jgi:hypothetical protein
MSLHISAIFYASFSAKIELNPGNGLGHFPLGVTTMMHFKQKIRTALITLTLAIVAVSTFAIGNRAVDPAQRMSYIFSQLNLTESQQAEALDLLIAFSADQRSQMQAQREAIRASDTRPTHNELLALRDSHRSAQTQVLTDRLNTLLAPEITAELVTYLDAHRGGMMSGGRRGGDGSSIGRGHGKHHG